MNDYYNLLRNKDIIAILDGDCVIEELNGIKIAMPYLSGPMICEISQKFGYYQGYFWGVNSKQNLSRWQYMDNILKYVVTENKVNHFLSYLMQRDKFTDISKNVCNINDFESVYEYTIKKILDKINSILYFGGHKLVVINNQFIIKDYKEKITIDVPNINIVDREYIKDLSRRAMKDIDEGNLDSAITKSRTILEEIFCYVIEIKNEIPSDSGDIGRLFKQVKDLYCMHTDKNANKCVNKLLSGLENIVQSIAEMRNNVSDSHGVGNKRVDIMEHHARLAVNSSKTMAEFILSISQIS